MLKFKQGHIINDRDCWTLVMYYPIDKSVMVAGKYPKNNYAEIHTWHGTLQQAVSSYCDEALKDVEPEVLTLLERLNELTEEIRSMNLKQYKRY